MHINARLYERLTNLCREFGEIKHKKSAILFTELKKGLARIRREYKKASLSGGGSVLNEWLCDNYYMIEQDGKALLKDIADISLPASSGGGFPHIYKFVSEAVLDSEFEFSTESCLELISIFEKKRCIQNFELDFFKNAVRVSAISGICKAVTEKPPTEKTIDLIGKCVRLLANIDKIDMDIIIKEKNRLDIILQEDPSGFYSKMNETTKQIYRYKISRIALKTQKDEITLAREYITAAQKGKDKKNHVGYYIYSEYEKRVSSEQGRRIFIPLQWEASVTAAIIAALLMGNILWLFLIFIPLWSVVKPLLEQLCTSKVESEYAPRLELEGNIPPQGQTIVAVTTLLPSVPQLDKLRAKLEKLYFTNGKGNVTFMVLADLKQAKLPVMPQDRAQIKSCVDLIESLNKKYNNKFMLLIRKRSFSSTGQVYTGAERKRGAITDLVSLIKGEDVDYNTFTGDFAALTSTKYILALDYDTKALLEAASSLVSVAMHPLNKPEIDENKGIVTAGYGIIAPKMASDLQNSMETPFTKVMCGAGGISAYDMNCTDLYQDLYSEGIFSGKGLICVDSFHNLMKDIFLPETVLSHDILEGSFLRTRFVYDVELSDGFPSSAEPYFKRLHRWIRGDFQNVPFIFRKVNTQKGKIKNPISGVSRFKLLDNIIRSLNPVFALACLITALFTSPAISGFLAVAGTLAMTSSYVFGLFRALLSGGLFALSRNYYSNIMPHTFELLSQIFYNLILLPQYAYNAADAAIRGLYRRFISHKKMLEWVPAAGANNGKTTLFSTFRFFWFCELLSLPFLFSGYGFMRLFGILFVCAVFLAYFSAHHALPKNKDIPEKMRDDLISDAAAMWDFYCDYAGKSENYLPPDNVQEAPVYKIAPRTSPTNIGLMLLSILSARDLNFIDTPTLHAKIKNTLTTIEKLEKWRDNLYNWYDTRTLETLKPSYVSAVDSGNFLCCLVALKEGLRDYIDNDREIADTIRRIEIIIDDADLQVFYDKNKKLFAIGYDGATDKMSPSYYDTLMSEARMLSYFAIAKRQVTKKHWTALSRTLTRYNSFTGPVSWTGTMFEYFMPELLLRSHEGSLSYEGLRFCLYCQKRRAHGIPYGISESGFYAFDTELNYQYKAHGVQKIALKRGMDRDLVISPYSTYLTLSYDFNSAYRNLTALKKLGASGKYGHYEAVDFTRSRTGASRYRIVKSYMAHHVGMSIIAVTNALLDDVMQKRFLGDKLMQSASELLEEKINDGAVIYQGVYRKETAVKNFRETAEELEYNKVYPHSPRVKLLSNGEMTAVITDSGSDYTLYHGQNLTRQSQDLLRRPAGIFAAIKASDTIIPFTNAPDYSREFKRTVIFSPNSVSFLTEHGDIQCGMLRLLHPTMPVQQIEFAVKNNGGRRRNVDFYSYLEPLLTSFADDNAHPAFSKLFLQVKYDKTTKVITAERKQRKNEKPIFMAVGFLEDVGFEFEARREEMLSRPYGIESLFSNFDKPFSGKDGVPDSCIAIKSKIDIPARSQKNFRLLISAGGTENEAVENIIKIRENGPIVKNKAAKSPIIHDSIEGRLSAVLLPQLIFNKGGKNQSLTDISQNRLGLKHLWPAGISGDLPIVTVELEQNGDDSRIQGYLNCHHKLRMCGIVFDLVFTFREGGEYSRSFTNMLSRCTREIYGEHRIGKRGGVHFVDLLLHNGDIPSLLRAASCHIAPKSMIAPSEINYEYKPVSLIPVQPLPLKVSEGHKLDEGVFHQDSFYFSDSPKLPWCHILANSGFGTLVSDRALGYTWAINSRENKLTPWYNDTMSDNRGEMLTVRLGERYYDIINGSQAIFNPGFAEYHGTFEDIHSRVKISVPQKGMVKYIDVIFKNTSNVPREIDLAYYTEPTMAVSRSDSRQINGTLQDNILLLNNPFNQSVRSYMGLTCDRRFTVIAERPAFLCGRWKETSLPPKNDMCAAMITKIHLNPEQEIKTRFSMSFGCTARGACELLTRAFTGHYISKNSLTIKSPDISLNYLVNTWLPWQTVAGRVFGRTGFYQCGGAYGFRDQLQDICSLIFSDPSLAKQHIIRACASQFEEGDVLHWWHNLPKYGGGKKGVRTRYTDDLLWLPYAVCEYLDITGDYSLLSVPVKYIRGPQLEPHEHEKYLETDFSDLSESVYEHCIRAITRACRFGEHGLPLIGGGDWNDGYNLVGEQGRGESVWLAQFLSIVLNKFAKVCEKTKDSEKAAEFHDLANSLLIAAEENCWDGEHYIRAFFDNGEVMGQSENEECQIDSLPQSFSVLSGMSDLQRQKTALNAVYEKLVDRNSSIIKLFTPAFDISHQEPGYVKSYPVGVRENGGQYTHAAVWFAKALLRFGEHEKGYEILQMINPADKYAGKEKKSDIYGLEPYYMTADIYANPACYGRGGWSIYTGAAAWYCRTVTEDLLGIQIRDGKLTISPAIPDRWDGFSARLTMGNFRCNIKITRNMEKGLFDNGKKSDYVPVDSNNHEIEVNI